MFPFLILCCSCNFPRCCLLTLALFGGAKGLSAFAFARACLQGARPQQCLYLCKGLFTRASAVPLPSQGPVCKALFARASAVPLSLQGAVRKGLSSAFALARAACRGISSAFAATALQALLFYSFLINHEFSRDLTTCPGVRGDAVVTGTLVLFLT